MWASLLKLILLGGLQSVVERIREDVSTHAAMNEIIHSYLLGFYSSEPPCHNQEHVCQLLEVATSEYVYSFTLLKQLSAYMVESQVSILSVVSYLMRTNYKVSLPSGYSWHTVEPLNMQTSHLGPNTWPL